MCCFPQLTLPVFASALLHFLYLLHYISHHLHLYESSAPAPRLPAELVVPVYLYSHTSIIHYTITYHILYYDYLSHVTHTCFTCIITLGELLCGQSRLTTHNFTQIHTSFTGETCVGNIKLYNIYICVYILCVCIYMCVYICVICVFVCCLHYIYVM